MLFRSGQFNVLHVTDKGWRVLKGNETPTLLKPRTGRAERKRTREARRTPKKTRAAAGTMGEAVSGATDAWEDVDPELFETLRALRKELADKKRIPAYVVFSDAALRDMARRKPSTREELLECHGVGEKKCRKYGEVFLKTIAEA